MRACHRCSAVFEEPGQPGFNNTCARCGMPLHSCMNCVHFVAKGTLRCLVAEAEPVMDPTASNQCAWFDFASTAESGSTPEAVLEVRGSGAPSDAATARRRWKELFGD